MATAKKTNPALWARAKAQAKARMGGKHSARAMQLAVKIYKKAGGGYRGSKSSTCCFAFNSFASRAASSSDGATIKIVPSIRLSKPLTFNTTSSA